MAEDHFCQGVKRSKSSLSGEEKREKEEEGALFGEHNCVEMRITCAKPGLLLGG